MPRSKKSSQQHKTQAKILSAELPDPAIETLSWFNDNDTSQALQLVSKATQQRFNEKRMQQKYKTLYQQQFPHLLPAATKINWKDEFDVATFKQYGRQKNLSQHNVALMFAAKAGNIATFKSLLTLQDLSLNFQDITGRTFLGWLYYYTNQKRCSEVHQPLLNYVYQLAKEQFIQAKENISIAGQGKFILWWAVSCRQPWEEINNIINKIGTYQQVMYQGMQLIHCLAKNGDISSIERLEKLIAAEGNVSDKLLDTPTKGNMTPLMYAVYENEIAMVEYLLQRGADPNAATHTKQNTALYLALKYGYAESALLLLAAKATVVWEHNSPLHVALEYGNLTTAQVIHKHYPALLNAVNTHHETPLFNSVKLGDVNSVTWLLQQAGIDLTLASERVTYAKMTALHMAIVSEHYKIEIVTALIAKSAENHLPAVRRAFINRAGFEKETPLMLGVKKGYTAAVSLLLQQPGIDLLPTKFNRTALAWAQLYWPDNQALIEMLTQAQYRMPKLAMDGITPASNDIAWFDKISKNYAEVAALYCKRNDLCKQSQHYINNCLWHISKLILHACQSPPHKADLQLQLVESVLTYLHKGLQPGNQKWKYSLVNSSLQRIHRFLSNPQLITLNSSQEIREVYRSLEILESKGKSLKVYLESSMKHVFWAQQKPITMSSLVKDEYKQLSHF